MYLSQAMWFLWLWGKLTGTEEHSSYLRNVHSHASLSSDWIFIFIAHERLYHKNKQWKQQWFLIISLWSRNWVGITGTVFIHLAFLIILSSVLFRVVFYNKMVYFSSHLVIGLIADTRFFIVFIFFSFTAEGKYNEVPCFDTAFLFAGFLWQTLWFMCLWSVLCRRWQFKGMSLALGIWFVLSHM